MIHLLTVSVSIVVSIEATKEIRERLKRYTVMFLTHIKTIKLLIFKADKMSKI